MSDSHSATSTPAQAQAKRPRPVISCLECRRKKLKCSRTHPCQQCVKIGRPGRCEYQTGQEPEPNAEYSVPHNAPSKRQRLLPTSLNDADEVSWNHVATDRQLAPVARIGIIEDLQERVTRLEQTLLTQSRNPNGASSISQPDSRHPLHPEAAVIESHSMERLPSISSQFSDACALMALLENDRTNPQILQLRTDLKDLHYSVEMNHHRRPGRSATRPPTTPHPLQLPPLDVCEKLAVLYFDNMEHCFRVLHWPQFREQLNILFTNGEHACRFGFVPQLVGALAVGVLLATHRECEVAVACSTIRPAEAIHRMESFLQGLKGNERYRLPALQVKMLLLICKWLNLDPFDDLFRLNGDLLRDALVMKMDKDPIHQKGIGLFEGELRRRNWMTLVEIDLMLSLLSKMPCMVPPYTTSPPRNINDDEIFEDMEFLPASRPTQEWTDGLCQYVLAQSFPRRKSACSQMDSAHRVITGDVLAHTRYLEKVLQDLPPPLRFNYVGDDASKTPARLMARMELDISIRRPLMHLYSLCALTSDFQAYQREIRAGFLQSCLMIGNYQDLFDPLYSELDVPRPQGYWDFFYTCYRQELGQATLGLCLEIKSLGSDDATHENGVVTTSSAPSSNVTERGPLYGRESLIDAVTDTLDPMRRRLPYRASKLKDVVYYDIVLTSLLPVQPGQDKEAMMMQRLQNLIDECRTELKHASVPNVSAPIYHLQPRPEDATGSDLAVGFDPLWEDFPHVDVFDPVDLNVASANSGA